MKPNEIKLTAILAITFILCACATEKQTIIMERTQPAFSEETNAADAKLLAELNSVAQANGKQLPPPAKNFIHWTPVSIGSAAMLIPPDWKTVTDFGEKPGSRIHTIGALSAKEDFYIELRVIQDSDSSYNQTPMDHAKLDYALATSRYAEKTILGFQPAVKEGVVGKIEIMNDYGKEKNDDASPAWRIILWDGRWINGQSIDKAELTARFAQDRYEEFAPIVSNVIASIKINH